MITIGRSLAAAGVAVTALCLLGGFATAGAEPGGASGGCPAGLPGFGQTVDSPGRATVGPVLRYLGDKVAVGPTKAVIDTLVTRGNGAVSLVVEYGAGGTYHSCTPAKSLVVATGGTPHVEVDGLAPGVTYHFRLVATTRAGTIVRADRTFTTLAGGHVPQGVKVGTIGLGGLSRADALALLQRPLATPLRLGFNGAIWHVPRAKAGAGIAAAGALTAALTAAPGSALPPLSVTVDPARLRTYVGLLDKRWSHKAQPAGVKLVGTHAVITPARTGLVVDQVRMSAELRTYLETGGRQILPLAVKTIDKSSAPPQKAVVIRLGAQTLTAYEDGKAVLTTPVTTGRPALPTPIGSYYIHFRASPYTFYSPWPMGSPYYYPPAPVTWAMEFYDGDFLHDDPAEPNGYYGAGSEYGPYASHGCVHVPHDTMAYLYNWLPVGAPVIVSQT
jgi:lipoprotein-anchoring transpeptidase ErfK/SrfK